MAKNYGERGHDNPVVTEGGDDGKPTIVVPDTALAPIIPTLPESAFTLPVTGVVLFPGMVLPVMLPSGGREQATVEQVESQGRGLVAVVSRRPRSEEAPPAEPGERTGGDAPDVGDLYPVGCLGRVLRTARLPDGNIGVLVAGHKRLRIKRFRRTRPVLIAEVDYPDEIIHDPKLVAALDQSARHAFDELVPLSPSLPDELRVAATQVEGAPRFADFVAASLPMDVERRQGFLSAFEIDSRLRALLELLEREIDLGKLSAQTREEVRKKVETSQRELYLREQLKAIRRELGEEVDAKSEETERFEKLIAERGLSEEAKKRAEEELKRLSLLPTESAEYHVIRTYLDWLVELPWQHRTPDNLDLAAAREILEADHYGLEEVKARFLEFLAVRKLKPGQQGAILCLAGPPGVGKTSLGQSIARATGRTFHRVSLGGMRDEAEIKGHRRTYVGAMPGKIIQGLRRVGQRNPVYMLDEIDKLGADWRGDPSSALLEVLDPAQNHAFVDHYLDVPFDLTEVMFIATANSLETIPGPLRDRMEIIEIPGYIPDEKREIARRYLLPRQLEGNGITAQQLTLTVPAIDDTIERYTREAGVRELERLIGRVCRKVATKVAEAAGGTPLAPFVVGPAELPEYLGPPRFHSEMDALVTKPGLAVGLAWTPTGGDVLLIEAVRLKGTGQLRLTGRLGEVMAESAQIARTVVRTRAAELGIDEKAFTESDLHLHVPAGAVPKDGPSAGITLATALVSLLTDKTIAPRLAMTGELTLRGVVTPIGGLRNKLVAAKRAGVQTVVVPAGNRPDLDEVPARVREGIEVIFAEEFDDVLVAAGLKAGPPPRGQGVRRPAEPAPSPAPAPMQASGRRAAKTPAPRRRTTRRTTRTPKKPRIH
jgi:ATP-dependent Lon protease